MKATAKTYLSLFLTFLKIGLFTFGGGYAMIALIEDEVVNKRKWISKEELTDVVTIAESTPGPIAINSSTYIGYKIGGVFGSFLATLAVVIPSFVIIFAISFFYEAFMSVEIVKWAFFGIKCAVGLIILRTGIKMLKSFPRRPLAIICFSLAFVGILLIDIFAVRFSSVYFILAGAVIGVLTYVIAVSRDKKRLNSTNSEGAQTINESNSTTSEGAQAINESNSKNSEGAQAVSDETETPKTETANGENDGKTLKTETEEGGKR